MPEAGNPESGCQAEHWVEGQARVKKVTLIMEGGHAAAWVSADLHRWLPPTETEVTLVQAVEELTDSSWFRNEPRQYLETLIVRQNEAQQESSRLSEQLNRDGYRLRQSSMDVTSDE